MDKYIYAKNASQPIEIGYGGENDARIVTWDIAQWIADYGTGTALVVHQRPGDSAPYPCVASIVDDTVQWTVQAADVANAGYGQAQLSYKVGEEIVARSPVYQTVIRPSLGEEGEAPDDPASGWVDQILNAAQEAKDSAQAASASADAAAESATAASGSASNAAGSATAAETAKTNAEAAANTAAGAATAASGSATTAGNAAGTAGAAAEAALAAQGAAENAQEAAESAQGAAESAKTDAEAAAGTVQGIVDNLDGLSEAIAIKETATGEVISVSDSAAYKLQGLKLYGKSVQDGTPTPEAPVEIEIAGDGGSITVTLSDGADQPQTLTCPTPNGLPGIPVEDGGNYTDSDGQQWICDEVDFGRGKYVQRVKIRAVTSTDSGGLSVAGTDETTTRGYINAPGKLKKNTGGLMSNAFRYGKYAYNTVPINYITDENSDNILFGVDKTLGSTIEEIRQNFINNGVKFLYVLAEPIETDLPAEVLEAYAALTTYSPATTITTDSDPAAGIGVDYVADTKTYIDNKLAAISEAILGGTTNGNV